MGYIKNVILEIEKTSKTTMDLIDDMKKKDIVQVVKNGNCVIVARYQVNKTSLRQLLADHDKCI